MNSIAQINTMQVEGPDGPTSAMMIALNISDAADAAAFVPQVIAQFKVHRMTAPPDTTMMLITLIGDLSAEQFVSLWQDAAKDDKVVHAFIALMVVADVVQGTKEGQELSSASLLPA